MGSRSRPTRLKLASVTLSQIEDRLGPGIGSDVLIKPDSGLHSRDRIFPLVRAFWSWIWQVLQSEASCRDVIQQLNALFALSGRPPIDPSSTAYCQARAHIPIPVLEKALHASACSAQRKARPTTLLGSRPIRIVDGSCIRLADTPANREAFPAQPTSSIPRASHCSRSSSFTASPAGPSWPVRAPTSPSTSFASS